MCAVSHERTRDEGTSEAKWGASVCGAFGVFPRAKPTRGTRGRSNLKGTRGTRQWRGFIIKSRMHAARRLETSVGQSRQITEEVRKGERACEGFTRRSSELNAKGKTFAVTILWRVSDFFILLLESVQERFANKLELVPSISRTERHSNHVLT
jgi:hypothetical protein